MIAYRGEVVVTDHDLVEALPLAGAPVVLRCELCGAVLDQRDLEIACGTSPWGGRRVVIPGRCPAKAPPAPELLNSLVELEVACPGA